METPKPGKGSNVTEHPTKLPPNETGFPDADGAERYIKQNVPFPTQPKPQGPSYPGPTPGGPFPAEPPAPTPKPAGAPFYQGEK